jgi:hypothetical protein
VDPVSEEDLPQNLNGSSVISLLLEHALLCHWNGCAEVVLVARGECTSVKYMRDLTLAQNSATRATDDR